MHHYGMVVRIFSSPDFWAIYAIISVLSMGVFWYIIYSHQWFRQWNDYDFPKVMIHFFVSVLHAVFWPITTAAYAAQLFGAFIRWVDNEEDHKAPQEEMIRCHKCASKIRAADSFCSLCGADQTELGDHTVAKKRKKSNA